MAAAADFEAEVTAATGAEEVGSDSEAAGSEAVGLEAASSEAAAAGSEAGERLSQHL
jgi:hypothetical protein